MLHIMCGHYLIDNIINGTIILYKNKKYEFNIDASGHPFMIKTELSTGTDNSYNTGIINNGTEFGKIEIEITENKDKLYYNCQHHASMRGVINIIDIEKDKGFQKANAYAKTIIIEDMNNIMDASCIYFTNEELFSNGPGHLPYSDQLPMNDYSIPYLCRWSFEIKRNILPSYYSDISLDPYYKNYT